MKNLILIKLFLVISFYTFSKSLNVIILTQQISKADSTEKNEKGKDVIVKSNKVLDLGYTLSEKNTFIEKKEDFKSGNNPVIFESLKPRSTPFTKTISLDTLKAQIELNSIKFALGNYFHSEIETNISNNDQKKGFSFSHNSNQIGFTNNWYSKRYGNKVSGFANFEPFNKLNFDNKISLHDQGAYFYGNEDPITDIRNKANKLEYQTFTYEGKLSNELTSELFEWEGLFTATKLNSIQNLHETNMNGQINLKAFISNNFKVALNSSTTNTQFKFDSIDLKRTLINAQPSITYKSQNFHIEAGLTYINDQAKSKEYFFPKIEVGYKLNNNHQFLAGFTGDVQFNNFQSLFLENLFLAPNQAQFTNTNSPVQIFTIFKGGNDAEETGFSYLVKLKYAQLNNLPIFIQGIRGSERDPLSFNTEYIGESETVNNFQVDVIFDKKLNLNWSTSLKLKTNNYSGEILYSNIILKPSIELNYQLTFQGLKWDFTPNIAYVSGLYGYQTRIKQVVKLDDIKLINLNIGYRLSRTFRLFSNLNNILNQKYQRIINYREIGFNFNAGILYTF